MNQTVRARYEYDPFGNVTKVSGDRDSVFLYTGHFWDGRNGLYLTLFRAYDPVLGRWISFDPIGVLDGTNLYCYVGGDPINYIDPYGLACTCSQLAALGISGADLRLMQQLFKNGNDGLNAPVTGAKYEGGFFKDASGNNLSGTPDASSLTPTDNGKYYLRMNYPNVNIGPNSWHFHVHFTPFSGDGDRFPPDRASDPDLKVVDQFPAGMKHFIGNENSLFYVDSNSSRFTVIGTRKKNSRGTSVAGKEWLTLVCP